MDLRELKKLRRAVKNLSLSGSSLAHPVHPPKISEAHPAFSSSRATPHQSFSISSLEGHGEVKSSGQAVLGTLDNLELAWSMIERFSSC